MKIINLKLVVFLLLGIFTVLLSPQKALAKNAYNFTWDKIATPSAITVDTQDNIYYAGFAASGSAIEFNSLPGHTPSDSKIATTGGIFLTKINAGLSTYGYSFLIEADDPKIVGDKPTSIMLTIMATDSANNIYLLGSFNGNVNFNTTTSGVMDFQSSGGETWQFLTEIRSDGVYMQTYFWKSPYITLRDIAFDQNNNIFVAGTATNTTISPQTVDLDIFTGTAPKSLSGGETLAFYTELSSTPYTYTLSRTFVNSPSKSLELDHIALDSNNNVYILGMFAGTVTFDGLAGPNSSTKSSNNNSNDLYLNKYNSSGTYVKTYVIGGTGNESAGTLAIDKNNNIYYSGEFGNINETINFNPIAGDPADDKISVHANQPFLTKLTSNGTSYGYTNTWTTDGLNIEKIAFYDDSLVYLTGESSGSIDFDPTADVDNPSAFGGNDAFLTVLNSDGSYNFSYIWGGLGDEKASDIAFDSFHDIYIAGSTTSLSINFDPSGKTSFLNTFSGGENGYISQFSFNQYVPPTTPVSTDNSGQNNNSNSSNSTPSCNGSSPSAPSIFQIWATKDKATMHFVPSRDQQNSYTVSYGPYSDAEMYNATFSYSDKGGAIPYTINSLNQGTVYYFKVRANNGCVPGSWSNTLSIRTAYGAAVSRSYAYNSAKNPSVSGGNVGGATCTQYTVRSGDSFWSIAQKLLGAGGRYYELWNSNKLKFPSLNSSSTIRTGWSLSVGC
jgi:nucleoid-associated protein YgaU